MERMTRLGLSMLLLIALSGIAHAYGPCDFLNGCPCGPPPDDSETIHLKGELLAGVAILAASYAFTTAYAATLPNSNTGIDALPLAGGVVAASREDGHARNSGVLLFGTWTQAVGLMIAAAAGVEIAEHRRLLTVGYEILSGGSGGMSGGMMTVTGRFR
jgi:hypothetical protein